MEQASNSIENAKASVLSKHYTQAFDEFVEADIVLQKIRISPHAKRSDHKLQTDISFCETEIQSLPAKIATTRNIKGDFQSAYVKAWLDIQKGFELKEQKQYREALQLFEDSAILLDKIQAEDPSWDAGIFKSRLDDINKELIELPRLIALEEASHLQNQD